MAQYIMLLHQGDFDFSGHSPKDMQAVVAKYGKWPQELGQAGKLIGGYFVIEAESLNEAVEISKSCPHIDYDGPIELREIDKH